MSERRKCELILVCWQVSFFFILFFFLMHRTKRDKTPFSISTKRSQQTPIHNRNKCHQHNSTAVTKQNLWIKEERPNEHVQWFPVSSLPRTLWYKWLFWFNFMLCKPGLARIVRVLANLLSRSFKAMLHRNERLANTLLDLQINTHQIGLCEERPLPSYIPNPLEDKAPVCRPGWAGLIDRSGAAATV